MLGLLLLGAPVVAIVVVVGILVAREIKKDTPAFLRSVTDTGQAAGAIAGVAICVAAAALAGWVAISLIRYVWERPLF